MWLRPQPGNTKESHLTATEGTSIPDGPGRNPVASNHNQNIMVLTMVSVTVLALIFCYFLLPKNSVSPSTNRNDASVGTAVQSVGLMNGRN